MTPTDTQLKIDISHALRSSLEAAAERAGVSVSDYLCNAIRRQLVADAQAPNAKAKFGPETARRIRENAKKNFGGRVSPSDSTELIRQMRNARIDDRH